MLRLAATGVGSWVEGPFVSEVEARERLDLCAKARRLTDAILWEYRFGCVVGSARLPFT